MSLVSLRKSAPSTKRSAVSVEEFIDEAVEYANGGRRAVSNNVMPMFEHVALAASDNPVDGPMRRATFTLDKAHIEQLSQLSQKTGIARSRLLRIWIEEECRRDDPQHLLDSKTR